MFPFIQSTKVAGFALCAALLLFGNLNAQVNKAEYFFDTDPGFGLGTAIPVTAAANIADQTVPVSLTAVANGFHNFFIRSRDAAGKWSVTNQVPFYKIASADGNVDRAEYFIDTDPGFGLATGMTITPNTNIADQNAAINLVVVPNGFHNLYIRSRDVSGKWSVTNQVPFYKIISGPAGNVDRVEYFVDTDPGFGMATGMTITPNTNIADQSAAINLATIPNGFHNLYIRSRDVSGKWSVTNQVPFYKIVPPVINTVQRVEYFIDTDPGFGLATAINVTAANNIADQAITISLGTLINGPHNLFIRSRDASGRWSITNQVNFQVGPPLPVSLLQFSATGKKWEALLNWTTTTESNSHHFSVERSLDGIHFTAVGSVAAAGQSNSQRDYRFTDDLSAIIFQPTKVYYRLQTVDLDNSRKASQVVSVTVGENKADFVLLQNPVQNLAVLQYTSSTAASATIRVIDMSGKKVMVKAVTVTVGVNQYVLEMAVLAKGIYAVQLVSSNGKMNIVKMSKE